MIKHIIFVLFLFSCSSKEVTITDIEIEKLKNSIAKLEQKSDENAARLDEIASQLQSQKIVVNNAIEKIQYQGGGSIAKEILFDKFPIFPDSSDKNYSYAISLLDSSKFNDAEYTTNFIIDKYLKNKDDLKKGSQSEESGTRNLQNAEKTFIYTLYLRGYLRYVQKKYPESVDDFSYIIKNYPDSEVIDSTILGLLFGYDRLGNSKKGCALSKQTLDIYKSNSDMYNKFNDKISKLHFIC